MQSYTLVIGRVVSRNGDFLAEGCIVDCGAKKIMRVCKSSLSAEVVALGSAIDLVLWAKILVVEFTTGKFLREMLDSQDSYALQTPFKPAPSIIHVEEDMQELAHLKNVAPTESPTAEKESMAADMIRALQEDSEKKLTDAFNERYVELLKTYVFADAPNAYASIMSGFPNTSKRFLRINLAYIRELTPLVVLTYIAKYYNLADSGSKSINGKHSLLQIAMRYNTFKFGFIGRRGVRGQIKSFVEVGNRRLLQEKQEQDATITKKTIRKAIGDKMIQ